MFVGYERQVDKLKWKLWEIAYSISYDVFGDLPITWDIKHKRNNAFFRYCLYTSKDTKSECS